MIRAVVAAALALMPAAAPAAIHPHAAEQYSNRHGGQALLIMQRGRLLLEHYDAASGPNRAFPMLSMTKSLCALGALAALAERHIPLDETVHRGMTWRQLLSQTSGLPAGYSTLYSRTLTDKSARALALKPTSPPGSQFAYGPSHYELLAALLEARFGKGAAHRIVWQHILAPLGMSTGQWRCDRQGMVYFSDGMTATPRQLLDAGRLIERHGWRDFQRMLPARVLNDAFRGSEPNPAYGLGFWLNQGAARPNAREADIESLLARDNPPWRNVCLSRRAPADLVVMAGSGGQRVYVSRSQKLVVVRLGKGAGFEDPAFLAALFGD